MPVSSDLMKNGPRVAAQVNAVFWRKWRETVCDLADTAYRSTQAGSVPRIWSAQLGFGVRNTERWFQWRRFDPSADEFGAVRVESAIEPSGAALISPADGVAEAETTAVEVSPSAVLALAAPALPDDLKEIRGVGPAIERKLREKGIKSFGQIAALSDTEIAELDAELDFRGRIARDQWVDQARRLAHRDSRIN